MVVVVLNKINSIEKLFLALLDLVEKGLKVGDDIVFILGC